LIARPSNKLHVTFVSILSVIALALVPAALAGKGGGGGHKGGGGGGTTGGSGTISLSTPLVKDVNGNGLPNWGDTVMFNVSTAATTEPYVHLRCYQNGALVAEGWRGYFSGSLDYPYFGLYSGPWMSGAADCTAYLETPTGQLLGSTSFHVDA
jgi:hypothetical protein